MVQRRDRVITVRLSSREFEKVRQDASLLGCSTSELVRALVSLPVSETLPPDPGKALRVVVFDRRTFLNLHRQLRSWGYHYNQAVHALNIVKSKRFMSQEDAYDLVSKAVRSLEELCAIRADFETAIDGVQAQCFAFLPSRGGR